MSAIDEQLEGLRRKHQETARYTLYLNDRVSNPPDTIIETGMKYVEAKKEQEERNANRTEKGFASPIYCIELEGIRKSRIRAG